MSTEMKRRIFLKRSLAAGAVGVAAGAGLLAPQQLPVGVLTALLGVPLFLYLLNRAR